MQDTSKFNIKNPIHFLALGFGSGLLKPAPGTWGTLMAIPIYYFVAISLHLSLDAYLSVVVILFVLGIYICGKAASDVGEHDHSAIVWDEIVGFLITMLAVSPTLINIVIGFILFRAFDIIKPWPIRTIDRSVSGGFGIMVDDVIAGFAACAVMHLSQDIISTAFA